LWEGSLYKARKINCFRVLGYQLRLEDHIYSNIYLILKR